MLIISHRGGSEEYIESSKEAFINSLNINVDGIECDVQFTKDNVPIINHNPTLKEHYFIEEFIENLLLKEIMFKTDNRIMILQDLLDLYTNNENKKLFIEIKGNPTTEQMIILLVILKNYKFQNNIIILSYNFKLLKKINDFNKLILIDNIFSKNILEQILLESNCNYIGIYYDIVTKKYINIIKKINKNIKIFIFTVNEYVIYKKFINIQIKNDINGIITDCPNFFIKKIK